jgi:hypothetical protein
MRQLLVAVSMAGIFAATSAFAQDTEETKVQVVGQTDDAPLNAIGVQFHGGLGFGAGVAFAPGVAIKYERAFSDMMSLALQPQITFGGGAVQFGLDADLRFHLMGESLNGLYIGPTAGFNLTSILGQIAPGFNAGAVVGYSYLINNMVQLGIGVGFTYNAIITPIGLLGAPTIPIRVGVSYAF